MTAMANEALRLARRGLSVFPCQPRGKVPLTPHGCKDATRDRAIIADWWRRWPDANLAVATGAPSGVFVIDIDGDDGEASLAELERQHEAVPRTVQSLTGKGRHLWFRLTEPVGNGVACLGAGIDLRGTGGYVIAPPSVHPSGRAYAWSVDHHPDDTRAVPCPDWLLELIRAKPCIARAAAPEDWRRLIAEGVTEGARNAAVARLTGLLLRRFIDPHVALDLVLCWNATRCIPPLPENEVVRTVASIAHREAARRENRHAA